MKSSLSGVSHAALSIPILLPVIRKNSEYADNKAAKLINKAHTAEGTPVMEESGMNHNLIVDSCCDMTPQLRERLDIAASIPLTMTVKGMEYIDDETLDLPAFLGSLRNNDERVRSASPTPTAYQKAMERAGSSFVVTLSSKLSGSFNSAWLGKNIAESESGADVHVFDSKSASAGETLLVMKLRELIEKGLEKSRIIELADQFIDNMKTYFVLEKYDNLQNNGRLSKLAGMIISRLNIRLIMGADGNGSIALFGKARGESNVLKKLLDLIANSGRETEGERLVITHCMNPSFAGTLARECKKLFGFGEVLIVPTGGLSSLYADERGVIMAF